MVKWTDGGIPQRQPVEVKKTTKDQNKVIFEIYISKRREPFKNQSKGCSKNDSDFYHRRNKVTDTTNS